MWGVAIVVGSQGVNDGITFSDVLAFGGGGGGVTWCRGANLCDPEGGGASVGMESLVRYIEKQ